MPTINTTHFFGFSSSELSDVERREKEKCVAERETQSKNESERKAQKEAIQGGVKEQPNQNQNRIFNPLRGSESERNAVREFVTCYMFGGLAP